MDQSFSKGSQAADPCNRRYSQWPVDYDIYDSEVDLERWPNLRLVLNDCEATIVAAYGKADEAARRYHRIHRSLVVVATICGMFAVLFAILQLTFLTEPVLNKRYTSMFKAGEVVAAVMALIAVVVGLFAAFSKQWLWQRERAERYRFLKFWFLLDVRLWSGLTSQARQDGLRASVEQLSTLNKQDLKDWAEVKNEAFEDAPTRVSANIDKKVLQDLIDYYEEKRICYQRHYFEKQAGHRHSWARFTYIAPTLFFFLSVVAALVHFSYGEYLEHSSASEHDTFSVLMIALAACLPVVGAAVRTLSSAHEFGRNTLRFRAAANNLARLSINLYDKKSLLARLNMLHEVEKEL
jgi:hypothetical protein